MCYFNIQIYIQLLNLIMDNSRTKRIPPPEPQVSKTPFYMMIGIAALATATVIFNSRYKVSRADQWISKTGLFVKDVIISKKTFVFPFQRIKFIDLSPYTVNFLITAMSHQKLEFGLPVVLTIGPKDDHAQMIKYSKLIHELTKQSEISLIKGLLEGEVRALAANVNIEQIFLGRNKFKEELFNCVETHLKQFGLKIYNGNIQQLSDTKGSSYFTYLSQKIQAEAENTAKVEVAEQNKIGNIGKAQRLSQTRQKVSIIEAQAVEIENINKQKIQRSRADLEKLKAEQDFIVKKANLESTNQSELIRMDLERQVQLRKAAQQLETFRANEYSKTTVEAEIKQKEAEGVGNALRIESDAKLYSLQKKAQGDLYEQMKIAQSKLYSNIKLAEGNYQLMKKEAEGLEKKSEALKKLVDAYGNPHNYIASRMIDEQVLVKIAKQNAQAIKGLNPKITVWGSDGKDALSPIKNLAKNMLPALDILRDQTGYSFPEWLEKKQQPKTESPITKEPQRVEIQK